jgi:hypothetical protein
LGDFGLKLLLGHGIFNYCRKPKAVRPRVLHFGDSYVGANTFLAEKPATPLCPS